MTNEINYFKVSDLPIVSSVPEGATVLAYNEGQLMRIDGSKLGGGVKIIEFTMTQEGETTCTHTYEQFQNVITTEDAYIIRLIGQYGTETARVMAIGIKQAETNFTIEFIINGYSSILTYNNDGTIVPN